MTLKLILAFVISFFAAAVIGFFLIPWLQKIKAGQAIREDGPTWHMSKSGTPTMGGLMFIISISITCVTVGLEPMMNGEYGHIFMLLFAMIYGAIGFLDDYEKLKKKQNLGLRASQKFMLQLVVAIAFVFLMRKFGYIRTELYVPFLNVTWNIPEFLYYVFAAFVIVGVVNSVNLTDGIDGLAAGTTIPVSLFFTAITFYWGEQFLNVGIFSAAITGGLMGFLIYNFNPAKVFMGDTGSLFLGGAVAAMAFAMDMPLILVTVGIMYMIETLSDIIQVAYFKMSKGKRIFRMAPFHHHLEMGGWSGKKWKEKELFVLFFSVSAVFAVISFLGIINRY